MVSDFFKNSTENDHCKLMHVSSTYRVVYENYTRNLQPYSIKFFHKNEGACKCDSQHKSTKTAHIVEDNEELCQ